MADQFKTQDYYKMLTHVVHELPHSKPGDLYSERFLFFSDFCDVYAVKG